mgnify:CR=1 FL=1
MWLLTISQAVQKNILVEVSRENIHPIDNGKAYEVKSVRISKLIAAAHNNKVRNTLQPR